MLQTVLKHLNKNVLWYNKNVDIKFTAHDAFPLQPSSGTLNIEIMQSQIIKKCFEAINQRSQTG